MTHKLLLLAAMAATLFSQLAFANPTHTAREPPAVGFNPPQNAGHWSEHASPHVRPARRMTNAERLARGLGLNRPVLGRHFAASMTSPTPVVKYSGIIEAFDESGSIGYVHREFNRFGELGLTNAIGQALHVEILYDGTTQLNIQHTDGNFGPFSLLGGIEGFSSTNADLSPGSYNYAYLGGVTETPANSPPLVQDNSFTEATSISKSVESAIWSFDPSTDEITVQWVNSDGSKPTTFLTYAPAPDDTLVLTGDLSVFASTFGLNGSAVSLKLIRS